MLPHDTQGHDRWHSNRCTGCNEPVNMAASGGVRDERERQFHDCCLKIQRAAEIGNPEAMALLAAAGADRG